MWSDPGVPGVTGFRRRRPQALAELLDVIRYGEVVDIFDALVAQLPRKPQAQRSAEFHRKIAAVHAVRHIRLRMHGIGYVDALPPAFLKGPVDHVTGLGKRTYGVKNVRKRRADPFGDVRPALFASQMRDLRTARKV